MRKSHIQTLPKIKNLVEKVASTLSVTYLNKNVESHLYNHPEHFLKELDLI